jgi:hypothetical protein
MSPLYLLEALQKELAQLLSGVMTLSGGPWHVYAQNPPPLREKGKDPRFPMCLIRLTDGGENDGSATQDAAIVLGVWDDTEDLRGFRDIFNAAQNIRKYLIENPEIDGIFVLKENEVTWTLPDNSDTHPKYYGAVLASFEIPATEFTSANA